MDKESLNMQIVHIKEDMADIIIHKGRYIFNLERGILEIKRSKSDIYELFRKLICEYLNMYCCRV